MKNDDSARSYRLLGLSEGASLEELDERYLQLTLIQNGPHAPQNKEEAKQQHDLLDKAYNTILTRFLRGEEEVEVPSSPQEDFTMKQITNAQDRIHMPSTSDEDLWISPEASRPSSSQTDSELPVPRAANAPGFSLREIQGDILEAPDRAVIVHAVNCQGVWGYGIAAQLKKSFPEAYRVYRTHCQQNTKAYDIIGTALLIPPQPKDYKEEMTREDGNTQPATVCTGSTTVFAKRRWIACLFTSAGYGRPNPAINKIGKDSKQRILNRTRSALEYLRVLLEEFGPSNFDEDTNWRTDDDKPGEIWSCKFNSGAFGVEWESSCAILEQEFATFERPWTIVDKVDKTKDGSKDEARGASSQD
ncbi:hypothetical protein A1O3_04424 [Capronia epimyces CBS 606.96]|uniref:ADP-ribose 1''-phosphate phosphatase n=1 Tax=Capronia epimyces CBS 606.96 TaxID=1182542 RepID=W9YYU4_9EURO|nr:uncharacterized protein A1O3_04424 [Capronia epimyces CBS 606.96]EXJ87464.1 hypothetical protein A1O3_04424 [Capronia epimyces CBS 606.96]